MLCRAYRVAIEKLGLNGTSWGKVTGEVREEMNALGIKCGDQLIGRTNAKFRQRGVFPHPTSIAEPKDPSALSSIKLTDYFPTARRMFLRHAEAERDNLSGKLMHAELVNNILPVLRAESMDNGSFGDGSAGQKLLRRLIDRGISVNRVFKMMKHVGIEYDPRHFSRKEEFKETMRRAWAEGKFANRRPKGQGKASSSEAAAAAAAANEGATEEDVMFSDLMEGETEGFLHSD